MELASCPSDVLEVICRFLDPPSLVNLLVSSKSLHSELSNNRFWVGAAASWHSRYFGSPPLVEFLEDLPETILNQAPSFASLHECLESSVSLSSAVMLPLKMGVLEEGKCNRENDADGNLASESPSTCILARSSPSTFGEVVFGGMSVRADPAEANPCYLFIPKERLWVPLRMCGEAVSTIICSSIGCVGTNEYVTCSGLDYHNRFYDDASIMNVEAHLKATGEKCLELKEGTTSADYDFTATFSPFSCDVHYVQHADDRLTARWGHTAVSARERFIVYFGGSMPGATFHDVIIYDHKRRLFMRLKTDREEDIRESGSSIQYGDRVHPSGRSGHSAFCLRDHLIIFGGNDVVKAFRETWVLNLAPAFDLLEKPDEQIFEGDTPVVINSRQFRRKLEALHLPWRLSPRAIDHPSARIGAVVTVLDQDSALIGFGRNVYDEIYFDDMFIAKLDYTGEVEWKEINVECPGQLAPSKRTGAIMFKSGGSIVLTGGAHLRQFDPPTSALDASIHLSKLIFALKS
uniref:F-box domain-containing protein n=2 Tax=Palpitomonas bilix TaxID=652834 RepID=A0A7S3DAE1_9EUKA|mmetsp:Transcript_29237/g.75295  ORF Transcript_29237/g.75295 Transcript_29237/m.75295 type:complete len:519 (+) Transcript_29237:186-1742(+)